MLKNSAEEFEEYVMAAPLAQRMTNYKRQVEDAEAVMLEASMNALSALGVEGEIQIKIIPDPLRFRITRPEGPLTTS